MRKTNLLLVMLASFAVLFTSCKGTDEPTDETKEITLAVSGGNSEVITVSGTDVVKDVLIKATENVDRDIEVNLMVDAMDGSATLAAAKATITKGTDNATVKITFPAAKFPEGTAEKTIKVTASTNADKVQFSPAFTTFNVKGEGGQEVPAVLTASAEALEVNTTAADGSAVINFTLSKAIDEDITVSTEYGTASDLISLDGVVWNPTPIVIAKNTTTLKVTITVPKGRVGSLPINFSCENSKVNVETKNLTFKFVVTAAAKPEASISTTGALAVAVDGSDVVRTMDVKLSKAVDKTVTVNLAVTSNNALKGTLSASSVTFAAGELAKTVNITFANADFGKDAAANVTVTITSTDVDVKTTASTLLFNVAGPTSEVSKQDGQIAYSFTRDDDEEYTDLSGEITFTEAEKTQGYIYILVSGQAQNQAIESFNPAISFDYEVTGTLTKADIVLDQDFCLVYDGVENYGYANFKLMKSAIGKSGKLTFTSNDTTFAPDQGWNISVK